MNNEIGTTNISPPSKAIANLENHNVNGGGIIGQSGFFSTVGEAMETIENVKGVIDDIKGFMDRIKNMMDLGADDELLEAVIARLEAFLLLICDLSSRSHLKDMLIPMTMYLKTWIPNKSIAKLAIEMLRNVLCPEDEFFDVIEGQSGWFSSNWTDLVEGQFGARLAGAISILIFMGILPEKASGGITREVYNVLHLQTMRNKFPSVLHHVFHTLDWALDCVLPAIVTQNWSLLLHGSDFASLDEMYRRCVEMASLTSTAQHNKLKEKYGILDEAGIIVYFTNTIVAHESIKRRTASDSSLQRELQARLIKLDKMSNDIQAGWHDKALRVKPYAICLRGGSSVGKSVLAGVAAHAICQANGLPEGREHWVTLNGSDKYQSEYKSQHVVAIFDDVGNTRVEKTEGNPMFLLIQFINNMHCAALSPEADRKGKNDIRSKVVIVTTNTKDLHSFHFSVNPASIMRRFDLIVDVELRPDSVGPTGGLHSKHAGNPMPDAWNLKLSSVHVMRDPDASLNDKWCLQPVLEGGIVELIEYLHEVTPQYYATQEKIVDASDVLASQPHCEVHPAFTIPCPKCCQLVCADLDPNACVDSEDDVEGQAGPISDQFDATFEEQKRFLEFHFDGDLMESDQSAFTTFEQMMILRSREISPVERIRKIAADGIKELNKLRSSLDFEVSFEVKILSMFVSCALVGFGLSHLFEKRSIKAEGAVLTRIDKAAVPPSTFVEKDDKYQKVCSNIFSFPEASTSCRTKDFEAKLDRNLHVFEITEWDEQLRQKKGKSQWCNAFPVGGTEWVTVDHQFKKGAAYLLEGKSCPTLGVKRFRVLISESSMRRVPETDLIILDIPGAGDTTDLRRWMPQDFDQFPIEKGQKIAIYHAHRDVVIGERDFEFPSSYKTISEVEKVDDIYINGIGTFREIMYHAPNHKGMCGSLVVLMSQNPVILGVHNGGNENTGVCVAVPVNQLMFEKSPSKLFIKEEVVMPNQLVGRDFSLAESVHRFNPIHYMEHEDHNLTVYGQHDVGTAKFKTSVMESPLLEPMREILGYEPTHTKPPKSGARKSYRRHFEGVTGQSAPVHPDILDSAYRDYIKKLDDEVLFSDVFRALVHPVSSYDAVNGVPGVDGFDSLNVNSSLGFAINCPKWKALLQNDADALNGIRSFKHTEKRIVNGKEVFVSELIWDNDIYNLYKDLDGGLQIWLNGKRTNHAFRTNLKDEPLSFAKAEDGVIRIFGGANVVLVTTSRMTTSALLAIMKHFPFEFECAVGIDATGKDWQVLSDHMREYGEDRCGDGDYSKYDINMSCEFTTAAFQIVRYILQKCGYTEELLSIFDGVATECIYPVYECDGLLYKAFRSNPSGHGLTVIINSLCNSLLQRYAYYRMYDARFGEVPTFGSRVNLMTYGDDFIWNVSREETKFCMREVAKQLATIDMKLTDANKNVIEVDYINHADLSFLKRTFHYHPALKAVVGPLEMKSIWKSLALTKRPKASQVESTAEICASNLVGALVELYYHGEEVYDEYLPKFLEIAKQAVDMGGNRVIDYYTPIMKEEIIERFNKTVSTYEEARKLLIEGIEGQSGVVDSDSGGYIVYARDYEVARFSYSKVYRTRDNDRRIDALLQSFITATLPGKSHVSVIFHRGIKYLSLWAALCDPRFDSVYVRDMMLNPYRRMYCPEKHFLDFGIHTWDYRSIPPYLGDDNIQEFSDKLTEVYNNRCRQRRMRRRCSEHVGIMFMSADLRLDIFHRTDWSKLLGRYTNALNHLAYNIIEKLVLRRKLLESQVFYDDLVEYISDFAKSASRCLVVYHVGGAVLERVNFATDVHAYGDLFETMSI